MVSSQSCIKVPSNDDPAHPRPGPSSLIGIDYDEFKPETYRGCFVIVSENGIETERRNFDWWDQAEAYAHSLGNPVLHLSSVDDFAADQRRAQKEGFGG